ncbi:o-succinylbenzoic acid synthetase [Bernardetia litoralis DSM 6794]|uniref:o-succinylbenzoate synthase n=1 Tax=Bernardetia litoralis (strain ATCC 23117 / DSM 6794 / NBRC 15988 / NCIMB 1366 / Fx l1 / Sio-4) TaxID=880071 RepID=I4AI92_BERLS|nr:o-succinylbenzoate synthase [Bernardetia litoralis]AFM03677.1 o-succinylbenzoic acid synthetase [Bernardetia litoralis DSM 6794]
MYSASYKKHRLKFRFLAGTSRGIMKERDTYFVYLSKNNNSEIIGTGEISPLFGLSIDFLPNLENIISDVCKRLENTTINSLSAIFDLIPASLPAVRFGFETAFLDLQNGGNRIIYKNDFSLNQKPIPINGLVWMGDFEFMQNQLEEKLEQGFSCIKLKIGAIDFEKECKLLESIRKRFDKDKITIRVDANGAFPAHEALQKLRTLSNYAIHSIEQPIAANQWYEMKHLCKETPLPIALDEELIPLVDLDDKKQMLDYVKPQYLIFKPTLLGGLHKTAEWIELCKERNIDWWITSALESNIGLNAISQFVANYNPTLPQGLGTGKLYHNNIESSLEIANGEIFSKN